MRIESSDRLLSLPFLGALVLLLLNDLLFKATFNNPLTGKLSDFAGLFVFPVFWSTLFPRYARMICVLTSITFVVWKSPFPDPILQGWNRVSPWDFGRTPDWSDLTALVMIPLAYRYATTRREGLGYGRRTSRPILVVLSLFAFAATSYRTSFEYDHAYSLNGTSDEIIGLIDSMRMYRYGGDLPGYGFELRIPAERCFDEIEAKLVLEDESGGLQLRIRELTHRCPERAGDSLDMLRIVEHCLLKRLDSAWVATRERSDSLSLTRALTFGQLPREGCEPRR